MSYIMIESEMLINSTSLIFPPHFLYEVMTLHTDTRKDDTQQQSVKKNYLIWMRRTEMKDLEKIIKMYC